MTQYTFSIEIPELEFEMGGASVGGKFTTLEGLLTDLLEQVQLNSSLALRISGCVSCFLLPAPCTLLPAS